MQHYFHIKSKQSVRGWAASPSLSREGALIFLDKQTQVFTDHHYGNIHLSLQHTQYRLAHTSEKLFCCLCTSWEYSYRLTVCFFYKVSLVPLALVGPDI